MVVINIVSKLELKIYNPSQNILGLIYNIG